jgi:hypothetical protein
VTKVAKENETWPGAGLESIAISRFSTWCADEMIKTSRFQNSHANRVGLTVTSGDGYILQIPLR